MFLSDFDYELPQELIAQYPVPDRAASRMLVMDRASGACELRMFRDFPLFLRPGDCLVLNDTKVIPARIFGMREKTGSRVELLLLEPDSAGVATAGTSRWKALVRPGRRQRPGDRLMLEGAPDQTVTILAHHKDGTFSVEFRVPDVLPLLERIGRIPLPPYIERADENSDRDRYQTVYAQRPGAVAAPTAGLHFTPDILAGIEANGIKLARVTLHVGAGTFQPVKAERIEDHVMHAESYELSPAAASVVNATRTAGGRVIAIGTTSVRVLESCTEPASRTVRAGTGRTRLFLHPPLQPKVVDGLLTNFHLPRSTLLMLVSTFSTLVKIKAAYALAVRERFRFFSYGDCMLLLPE